jgi:hypothetical protein
MMSESKQIKPLDFNFQETFQVSSFLGLGLSLWVWNQVTVGTGAGAGRAGIRLQCVPFDPPLNVNTMLKCEPQI